MDPTPGGHHLDLLVRAGLVWNSLDRQAAVGHGVLLGRSGDVVNVQSETTTWFDEVDLDPDGDWLRMGTRQLGARPWLVVDEFRGEELALKQRLSGDRHEEVFAAQPDAVAPGSEVLALVANEYRAIGFETDIDSPVGSGTTHGLHPLDAAGRMIQEDLCLLRRDDVGWVLAAASLCFPSRWRLAEKMGRTLTEVHQPVDGYDPKLAGRVDSLFDRIDEQMVWRRNWFIHPSDALFQPDRPPGGDPTISQDECEARLVIRSERQTLRRLPESGWILFTVRIQQASLGRFLGDPDRRASFIRFVANASAEHCAHRGLSTAQIAELRLLLAIED